MTEILTNETIIQSLGNMNALQLKQLADAIKSHFDIKEMAMGGGHAPAAGHATKAAAVSEYDIKIKGMTNKLAAIKLLKDADWSKADMMSAKTYLENDGRPMLTEFLKTQLGGKKFAKDKADAIHAELKAAGVDAEVVTV